MRRKHSKVLLTIQYLLMCVMTTQNFWLDCQIHLQSDMGQCYSDFRHWNDDYQLAVCSFHFQPTSVSWRSQGLGLGSVGDEQYWVVVLRVLDSPILRTVVPGVELQKHTKTEICLGQGEHSLYTPFQSEVIDMRCCLRLRLSPAFAMRHDISPNCR